MRSAVMFLVALGWFAAGSVSPALAQASAGDEWLTKPVDDQTFRGFLPFFRYDQALPLDVRILEPDEQDGIAREHLSFQSTPGQRVTARIFRATIAAGGRPGWVVLLHGGTAAGKDNPSTRYLGGFLARAGWNVLAIDMQYFGDRKTDLLTQFTEAEKHERLYNQPAAHLAWVAQTVKDGGRAFDFLVQERGADPKRIALMGFSRGAQMAFLLGGADPRFVAVAALYGGHFDAFETGHLPAACPANYIGRIAPRPLLMVNGTQDTDFFREVSVLPLQKLARNPRELIWVDTGHTVPPMSVMPQVSGWLQKSVK